jgi:hypothetical protein
MGVAPLQVAAGNFGLGWPRRQCATRLVGKRQTRSRRAALAVVPAMVVELDVGLAVEASSIGVSSRGRRDMWGLESLDRYAVHPSDPQQPQALLLAAGR